MDSSIDCQIVLLEKGYSKIVYKELRNRIITPPTAKPKFNAHFVNDTLNWKKISGLSYRVALLDTKTREFQYKLPNRCLVTNTFVLYHLQRAPYVVNQMNPSNIFSRLVILLRISGLRL